MSPEIGNVESGVNIPMVKKAYVDDYAQASERQCAEC
jgi:hypothetical protein